MIERIREVRQELKKLLHRPGAIKEAGPDGMTILALAALMENMGAPNPFADVVDFHRKFNINYEGGPRKLPMGVRAFRRLRLEEELKEYEEALAKDDAEGQFDGLIDIIYIALGTIHLNGWDFHEGWRRVHEVNMSKVRATPKKHNPKYGTHMVADDGKPADIVKPDGWKAADLLDLVTSEDE